MNNWFTESSSQPQTANCGIRIQTGYKNRARRPPRAPQATQDRPRPSPDHPQHPQATPRLKLQKYVKVLIWKILAMTARLGTQNLQNFLFFIVKLTMYFTKLALQLLIAHYFFVIILILLSCWYKLIKINWLLLYHCD